MDTHLHFDTQTSRQKPETIRNKTAACPFCDVEALTNIIEMQGPIILMKNKYPTLKNTSMNVLIETDVCQSELSEYPSDHLHKLFRFAISKWQEMVDSREFKSVILYKNHGPFSGGSIRHPHMQIVGLKDVDCMAEIKKEYFIGESIFRNDAIDFNLSSRPKVGFYEINVLLKDRDEVDQLADCVQKGIHYLLNHHHFKCESYNLFFYRFDGMIACKIMPRFVVSPFYMGYSLPQVPVDVPVVAERIRSIYFS